MSTDAPPRREAILDVAEAMMREAGYHGVSTRAVAERVGIRAPSLLHHFPSKADLGVQVAERYRRRFLDRLGDPSRFGGDRRAVARAYGAAFAGAIEADGRICLCAVLGAESAGLPVPVAAQAARFFRDNLAWLEAALDPRPEAATEALVLLSVLEGAMVLARSLDDPGAVGRVADALAGD